MVLETPYLLWFYSINAGFRFWLITPLVSPLLAPQKPLPSRLSHSWFWPVRALLYIRLIHCIPPPRYVTNTFIFQQTIKCVCLHVVHQRKSTGKQRGNPHTSPLINTQISPKSIYHFHLAVFAPRPRARQPIWQLLLFLFALSCVAWIIWWIIPSIGVGDRRGENAGRLLALRK